MPGRKTLDGWLGDETISPDEAAAIAAGQRESVALVRRHNAHLDATFVQRAFDHALRSEAFYKRITGPGTPLDEVPFVVRNLDVLRARADAGRGVLVVVTKTGFWHAIAVFAAQMRLNCAMLFEYMPPPLVAAYTALGVGLIQAVSGVTVALDGGRSLRIPGSQPLSEVCAALDEGLVVGIFGDTHRRRGVRAQLLGVDVELIDHYALLAVRQCVPLIYLRQWVDASAVHLEFVELDVPARPTRRNPVRLVHQFAALLDADLQQRPHQYFYGSPSVFSLASAQAEHRR